MSSHHWLFFCRTPFGCRCCQPLVPASPDACCPRRLASAGGFITVGAALGTTIHPFPSPICIATAATPSFPQGSSRLTAVLDSQLSKKVTRKDCLCLHPLLRKKEHSPSPSGEGPCPHCCQPSATDWPSTPPATNKRAPNKMVADLRPDQHPATRCFVRVLRKFDRRKSGTKWKGHDPVLCTAARSAVSSNRLALPSFVPKTTALHLHFLTNPIQSSPFPSCSRLNPTQNYAKISGFPSAVRLSSLRL